jgi:hypothetical protein
MGKHFDVPDLMLMLGSRPSIQPHVTKKTITKNPESNEKYSIPYIISGDEGEKMQLFL